MHPIFGYITSNVLFHLSSLHFTILGNIPILCPSCPSPITVLTVLIVKTQGRDSLDKSN